MNDCIELLKNPEIFKINSKIKPFQDILKSFVKDRERRYLEFNQLFHHN